MLAATYETKIDVVIPTKGEWSLPFCIRSVRKSVPINNLILVAPSFARRNIENLSDIVVLFDEKNVGKARIEGLKMVETPIYASVDSDVLVTPEWFKWCWKTIQQPDVGACQGYARHIYAKNYDPVQMAFFKRGGMYGKGLACLGNTLLKTEIVKEVGIPEIAVREDWILRLKMEKAGYKWISNIDIVCPHLKTDVDVWKHGVWWGMMGGEVDVKRNLLRIGYHCTIGLSKRPLTQNLFLVALQISALYGVLKGKMHSALKR